MLAGCGSSLLLTWRFTTVHLSYTNKYGCIVQHHPPLKNLMSLHLRPIVSNKIPFCTWIGSFFKFFCSSMLTIHFTYLRLRHVLVKSHINSTMAISAAYSFWIEGSTTIRHSNLPIGTLHKREIISLNSWTIMSNAGLIAQDLDDLFLSYSRSDITSLGLGPGKSRTKFFWYSIFYGFRFRLDFEWLE